MLVCQICKNVTSVWHFRLDNSALKWHLGQGTSQHLDLEILQPFHSYQTVINSTLHIFNKTARERNTHWWFRVSAEYPIPFIRLIFCQTIWFLSMSSKFHRRYERWKEGFAGALSHIASTQSLSHIILNPCRLNSLQRLSYLSAPFIDLYRRRGQIKSELLLVIFRDKTKVSVLSFIYTGNQCASHNLQWTQQSQSDSQQTVNITFFGPLSLKRFYSSHICVNSISLFIILLSFPFFIIACFPLSHLFFYLPTALLFPLDRLSIIAGAFFHFIDCEAWQWIKVWPAHVLVRMSDRCSLTKGVIMLQA